jgi:hypothetical protein
MVDKKAVVTGPVYREHTPLSRMTDPPVTKPAGDTRIPDPVAVSPPAHTVDKRAVVQQPGVGDDPEVTIISQIRDLEGIVAIAVFNDNRNIIMMGDADSEVLVKIARTMLETAKKMTPRLTWGPFVHMTIQIPAGNMIIAPYHDMSRDCPLRMSEKLPRVPESMFISRLSLLSNHQLPDLNFENR